MAQKISYPRSAVANSIWPDMSKQWQYQLRIDLRDDLAEVARGDSMNSYANMGTHISFFLMPGGGSDGTRWPPPGLLLRQEGRRKSITWRLEVKHMGGFQHVAREANFEAEASSLRRAVVLSRRVVNVTG